MQSMEIRRIAIENNKIKENANEFPRILFKTLK
jgi:hypothetical protein